MLLWIASPQHIARAVTMSDGHHEFLVDQLDYERSHCKRYGTAAASAVRR
jgi:hypothetical protein